MWVALVVICQLAGPCASVKAAEVFPTEAACQVTLDLMTADVENKMSGKNVLFGPTCVELRPET